MTPNHRKNLMILLLIGIIVILFLLRKCEGEKTTIKTPVISGTLTDTIHEVKYDTILLKGKERVVYKPIVQQIIVRDTVEGRTDTVYASIDTLKTQRFEKTFEDDYVDLRAFGTVTGRIEGMAIDYKLKSREIEISKPKRFGVGIGAGISVDLKPYFGVGVQYNIISF